MFCREFQLASGYRGRRGAHVEQGEGSEGKCQLLCNELYVGMTGRIRIGDTTLYNGLQM